MTQPTINVQSDRITITNPDGREFSLVNVHRPSACAGENCVIHSPSAHSMRDFPMLWRSDKGLMERVCPHGIGHPDPDALLFFQKIGDFSMSVHGCDGCCSK